MKQFGFIFSAALCALICVSCNKELSPADPDIKDPGQSSVEKVHMSFTAGIGTKVSLSEGESSVDIVWSSDDHIAVWDGTEWCDFAATSVDGSSAVFEGEITPNDAFTTSDYIAVYPFAAIADHTQQAITIKVPDNQVVPEGGAVDPSALVSVATCSAEGLLSFEQVCALVKINLAEQDMSAITLEGTGLAGTATCATDGSISSISDAAEKITLSAAAGTFAAGDYYIAALPATTTIKVGMVRESDGYTGVRSTASPVTLTQGSAKVYIKDSALNFEYNIYTPEQLLECAKKWNASFKETVNICDDIDMSSITWTPKNFAGVLNGNGKRIYNYQYTADANACFITNVYGTIKDICFGSKDGSLYDGVSKIVLANSGTSTSWFYAGLFVRIYENATVSNLTSFIPVELSSGSTVKTRLGGIVGVIAPNDSNNVPSNITVSLTDCTNYGTVSNNATTAAAASNMGGIIGRADIPIALNNVVNNGNVVCKNPYVVQLGGLSSGLCGGSSLINCKNNGDISYDVSALTAASYIGGIAGNGAITYTVTSTLDQCENFGTITLVDKANVGNLYIGGITGLARNSNLINCKNHGLIDCTHHQVTRLGGISGTLHASTIADGCINDGPVKLTQSIVSNFWQGIGGIAGNSEGSNPQIKNCSTTEKAAITVVIISNGANHNNKCSIGGIVGIPGTAATISGNTNNATITASNLSEATPYCYVGGIIGHVNSGAGGSTITGNTGNGTISNGTESADCSGAGGLFGKMDKANSISGNTVNCNVNGVNAGAIAGFNSQTISSSTISELTLVNSITKPTDPNEYALWICPNNTGSIN